LLIPAIIGTLAQDPVEGDTVVRVIEPILLPEVTTQSARVTSVLLEKSKLFITPEDRSAIRIEINNLVNRSSSLLDEQENLDLETIEFRELEDRKRMFDNLLDNLEASQGSVSGRAQDLDNERLILSEMSERWKKTLNAAREQNAPSTLIDRINITRSEISDFSGALQENSDFLLIQLDRLAGQIILINQSLADINDLLAVSSSRILSFNRDPLWQELFAGKDTSRTRVGSFGIVKNSLEDIRELYRDFQITLIINLVLVIIILFTIIFCSY